MTEYRSAVSLNETKSIWRIYFVPPIRSMMAPAPMNHRDNEPYDEEGTEARELHESGPR
jgi:hypothetical protein